MLKDYFVIGFHWIDYFELSKLHKWDSTIGIKYIYFLIFLTDLIRIIQKSGCLRI